MPATTPTPCPRLGMHAAHKWHEATGVASNGAVARWCEGHTAPADTAENGWEWEEIAPGPGPLPTWAHYPENLPAAREAGYDV